MQTVMFYEDLHRGLTAIRSRRPDIFRQGHHGIRRQLMNLDLESPHDLRHESMCRQTKASGEKSLKNDQLAFWLGDLLRPWDTPHSAAKISKLLHILNADQWASAVVGRWGGKARGPHGRSRPQGGALAEWAAEELRWAGPCGLREGGRIGDGFGPLFLFIFNLALALKFKINMLCEFKSRHDNPKHHTKLGAPACDTTTIIPLGF
jgi:hypothetical protein